MKRFLILFLIFIFSISAVSAENADLTEDDFIPVNLYQDTYILHDYTSSNVNINISSDVSGVSNDKALVNVNVDCEDNSSFNHYLDIYPNESSSPILVNIHDGAGSFYLPIDNSTDYFTAVFDEGKFDTSYAFTSIRQNFTISDSTEVISPDVDLSWDLALYMKSRLILKITVLMIWKTYHSISIAICQCVYLIIPLSMRDMTGFIPIKNSSSMELSRQISLAY